MQRLDELKTMHVTQTVKDAFGSRLFFQNSEYPRISYFGYKKLSFKQLNVFLGTNKKILALVG